MGNAAKQIVLDITKEVEVGEIYTGKVTKLMKFGAFIDVLNGKEGLLHISNIDYKRVDKVEDVYKVGDVVEVKVIGIDDEGRIDLSRKALLPKPEGIEEEDDNKNQNRHSDNHRNNQGPRRSKRHEDREKNSNN